MSRLFPNPRAVALCMAGVLAVFALLFLAPVPARSWGDIPMPGAPVCAACDGAGCSQCQPSSPPDDYPDPDPEPDPAPAPAPAPAPTPAPVPQPTPAPPAPDPQQQFERAKEALLKEFKMPPGLVDDIAQINLPPSSIVEPGLGAGPAPPGVTADEWKQAADVQQQIAALYAKQPMTAGDIAAAQALEAKRNQIWAKAIGNPALTSSQRKQLCMKLPTVSPSPASAPPPLSKDTLDQWNRPIPLPGANPAAPIPVPVMNPVSSWLNGEFAQGQAIGAVEFGGEMWADAIIEDSSYGDVLGVAKIAVAYKQDGAASAISEAASYLVGKIPIPQANVAVEGGRIYSGVVFQVQNKFMHDAMAAAGGQFDEEKFWTEFTDGLTTAQKAVKEFISYGP